MNTDALQFLDGLGLEGRYGFPSGMTFERGSSGLLWIGDDGAIRTYNPDTSTSWLPR